MISVATVLRRLGDNENAELARRLGSTVIAEIVDGVERDQAVKQAAMLLIDEAPAEDAVSFLLEVLETAPDPARKAFARMVFTGHLRARAPTNDFLRGVMSLAATPGETSSKGDRFRVSLARALVGLGDPERAHEIAMEIKTDGLWQRSYVQILPALSQVDPDRAIIAANGLTNGWKAAALFGMGVAMSRRADQADEAAEILRLAEEAMPEIPEANPGDLEALLASIYAARALGQEAEPGALDAARKLAVSISSDAERNRILDRIGRMYLRIDNYSRALGATRRMTGKKRDRLLWSVAMRQLDVGDSVAALKTISDVKDPGRSARALAEVALRLAKSGTSLGPAGSELLDEIVP